MAGFELKSHFVWIKSNIGLGWFSRGQHEVAYLLTKGSPQKPILAPSDVLYANGTGNDYHPTQKPVSLMTQILESYLPSEEMVLDPFAGSCSTLAAAKQLRRRAIGIEIEEKYCEIAARRCEMVQPSFFDTPIERESQEGMFQ